MTRCLSFLVLVALSISLHAQQITITNPVAGAQVPVGKRCAISWTSEGMTGQTVQIEISLAGYTPRYSIAAQVPVEAGQYEWDIPWEMAPSNPCTVYIGPGGEGQPWWHGPEFSIRSNAEPALMIRAPAGGEQWPRSATRSVSWEAHNLGGNLTLELLQAGAVVNSVSGIPVTSNRVHYAIPAGMEVGTNYSLRLTSAAASAVAATNPAFSVIGQVLPPKKWTILFYFDADAFMMEANTIQSFLGLASLPLSTNINYVCEIDRSPRYVETYANWWDTKRFVFRPGLEPTPENAVQDLGELNMSNPNALTDFINWAADNYPAEKYFLILSDHGSGWAQGVLLDETNGGHDMSTRELQEALEAADTPMTILGLDMCVEGQIEVAYQLRHSGPQTLIASQYQESRNWPYYTVFQQLESKLDQMSVEGLSALFCQAFVNSHSGPGDSGTLGAIRLNKVEALTTALAAFADTMMADYSDQPAVRRKADAVKTAFNDAVFYCARTRVLQDLVYGLDINFLVSPDPDSFTNYNPNVVSFAADSHWATFLAAYNQGMTNSWIGEARASQLPLRDEVDIYRFCQAISPATNTVKLLLTSVGSGGTAPANDVTLLYTNGQVVNILAIPTVPLTEGVTNYFVRWVGSDNAAIADLFAKETTVRVTGDALIMAYFATNQNTYLVSFVTEGNGGLYGTNIVATETTNCIRQLVLAGDDCSAVTALPHSGYAFAGWGGDYLATANPLTITNVQMDTTVIAFFWPAPPQIIIHQAGASVELSWPASAAGYVLESAVNFVSGPWNLVPGVTNNSVTLPIGSANQFFRLRQSSDQTR